MVSGTRQIQFDPLLAVSRIENEAGQTICTYPVISAVNSLSSKKEKKVKTVKEKPKNVKRKPLVKPSHREMMTKLRHKYVTEKHQNILICEKNGKLIATLRCVLCNLFVKKGEQFCYRCKEYLETGKKPPFQRKIKHQLPLSMPVKNKCKICSVHVKNNRIICLQCENVQKKIKKEPKLPGKVKSLVSKTTTKSALTKQVDKKHPTLNVMKKTRIIKKKVVKKRKKNRCESCNAVFVHNKGDLCQKCTKRFGAQKAKDVANVDSPLNLDNVVDIVKEETDSMTVQNLNSIENVEIVEEDDDGPSNTVFKIPLIDISEDNITDNSDYYVSIDDINNMLDDESET